MNLQVIHLTQERTRVPHVLTVPGAEDAQAGGNIRPQRQVPDPRRAPPCPGHCSPGVRCQSSRDRGPGPVPHIPVFLAVTRQPWALAPVPPAWVGQAGPRLLSSPLSNGALVHLSSCRGENAHQPGSTLWGGLRLWR